MEYSSPSPLKLSQIINEKLLYSVQSVMSTFELMKNNNSISLYFFGENIDDFNPLRFNVLKDKIDLLLLYKSQYDLNAYDWYELGNSGNNLINYVVKESFRKVI
mgnify:CR=1 FL=1